MIHFSYSFKICIYLQIRSPRTAYQLVLQHGQVLNKYLILSLLSALSFVNALTTGLSNIELEAIEHEAIEDVGRAVIVKHSLASLIDS